MILLQYNQRAIDWKAFLTILATAPVAGSFEPFGADPNFEIIETVKHGGKTAVSGSRWRKHSHCRVV
mgnify:CR=1 FL=1|jgi:hypothetical protein